MRVEGMTALVQHGNRADSDSVRRQAGVVVAVTPHEASRESLHLADFDSVRMQAEVAVEVTPHEASRENLRLAESTSSDPWVCRMGLVLESGTTQFAL